MSKDTDKDGIKDLIDDYPIETESRNGHMDKDGCPDLSIAELTASSEVSLQFNYITKA
jgi:hypothetical protein